MGDLQKELNEILKELKETEDISKAFDSTKSLEELKGEGNEEAFFKFKIEMRNWYSDESNSQLNTRIRSLLGELESVIMERDISKEEENDLIRTMTKLYEVKETSRRGEFDKANSKLEKVVEGVGIPELRKYLKEKM